MIQRVLKTLGISIAFLAVFLIMTFPYSRLSSKVRDLVEKVLSDGFGYSAMCTLDGFDFNFPMGLSWERLSCTQGEQVIIDLADAEIGVLPSRQTISAKLGQGTIYFKANAGPKSPPSRVLVELEGVPFERISPLLMGSLNKANPNIPKTFKASGTLDGKVDIPLANVQKAPGKVDLQLKGFKIPQQPFLELIGLKELSFSKSVIKAELLAGRLSLQDVSFLSDQISGKAEGQMELQNEIQKSSGNISLKWKVSKSDAILSAPLGVVLANAPCPSPDSEGFCTKKVQRLTELGLNFR